MSKSVLRVVKMKTQRQTQEVLCPLAGKPSRKITNLLAALVVISIVSAGPAFAFEAAEPASVIENPGVNLPDSNIPPPSMVDSCLPLLKSIRHTSPTSAMDRTQRSAGAAAALGVVIGLRFALGPKEQAGANRRKARLTIWEHTSAMAGDRNALAIADYRACQKDKALNALSGFRWER